MNRRSCWKCHDMGWLWLVGSMKLYVSFAKEPYKINNILPKRPVFLSILLSVATLYHDIVTLDILSHWKYHHVGNITNHRMPCAFWRCILHMKKHTRFSNVALQRAAPVCI